LQGSVSDSSDEIARQSEMMPMKKFCFHFASGLLALVLVTPLLVGQDDPFDSKFQAKKGNDDPFAVENKLDRDDPFRLENKAGVKSKVDPPSPKQGSFKSQKLAEVINFDVKVNPSKAKPGEVVQITIAGTPKKGYHTYPINRRTIDEPESQLSVVKITGPGLKALWPIRESQAEFNKNILGQIVLEHDKEFTWTQDVLVLPEASAGPRKVDIGIRLMVCDKDKCYGPDDFPPLATTLEVAGEPIALTPEVKKRLDEPPPKVELVTPPNLPDNKGTPGARNDGAAGSMSSLWGLLGAAFAGAFLMLLTPCVFPMIPITVNFFLKQSEKEHNRPLAVASVYSGTIIVLLTVVMLVLGTVVIKLANDPWFNLALGAVLIYFALSLFGMYDIELPAGLARFTSAREGQGGIVGAIFMAMTFTITSFTCTGPFLGALLAPVAGIQPPKLHLILAALVYSATFAAPFFVLALFPAMLRKLPKSGGWLNAIKVTMGFLEIGAALKFLSNTDMAWSPGDPRLFNYDTVLCAWIALSVACGLYLFGVFRLPHDDQVESIGVLRMIFATMFIGLAIYMLPALGGEKPRGVVGENLVAFLPPNFRNNPAGGNGRSGQNELVWHLDYIDGWKEAVKDNKLIFIDFTGVNCTNCRYNEENVFPKQQVHDLLKKYVRVRLFTDSVPNPQLGSAAAREQADRNANWRDKLGDPSNPFYIILKPNRNEPFTRDGLLNGEVLGKEKGTIFSVDNFVAFLAEPQKIITSAEAGRGQTAGLSWSRNFQEGLRNAQLAKKRVFLYFNAVTDTNCRVNDEVFIKPDVGNLLKNYERVELFVDWVPQDRYPLALRANWNEKQARAEGEKNLELEQNRFNYLSTPFYVILEPLPSGGFREIGSFAGLIGNEMEFRQFLANPEKHIARR
jgi:thiol:disulfide interchange protein DsbD